MSGLNINTIINELLQIQWNTLGSNLLSADKT
jgi:hypothetical protein